MSYLAVDPHRRCYVALIKHNPSLDSFFPPIKTRSRNPLPLPITTDDNNNHHPPKKNSP
jgi:hypothetical protein